MIDKVLVTVRKDDEAEAVWSRVLDRDADYFQRFRDAMQVDLDRGHSITIMPLSDLEAVLLDGAMSSVSWPERPG